MADLNELLPKIDGMGERIVAAAIQLDGVTFSLPQPARHHTVMHSLHMVLTPERLATATQGFLTSEGRFVNRVLARDIAFRASQEPGNTGSGPELFSEDLW